MANPFTPEQISQILEEFFKVVGTRQYIGARYVPIFGRKDEESIEWDNSAPYEPLTIVLYQGNSYTSRQYVPAGVDIANQEFWANTGNYNAQIETYRAEVSQALQTVNNLVAGVNEEIESLTQNVNDAISETNQKIESIDNYYSRWFHGIVVGHQGSITTAPGNTIPSFLDCGKYGYDAIECDVWTTADGHFVCCHDATIDASTNGIGAIAELTLAQIQSYNIDAGAYVSEYQNLKIPTFEEYLICCVTTGLIPFIELKNVGVNNIPRLIETVENYKLLSKAVFITSYIENIQAVKNINKSIKVLYIYSAQVTDDTINLMKQLNADGIDLDYGYASITAFKKLRDNGFYIALWSLARMNQPVNEWYQWGVDALTVDSSLCSDRYSTSFDKTLVSYGAKYSINDVPIRSKFIYDFMMNTKMRIGYSAGSIGTGFTETLNNVSFLSDHYINESRIRRYVINGHDSADWPNVALKSYRNSDNLTVYDSGYSDTNILYGFMTSDNNTYDEILMTNSSRFTDTKELSKLKGVSIEFLDFGGGQFASPQTFVSNMIRVSYLKPMGYGKRIVFGDNRFDVGATLFNADGTAYTRWSQDWVQLNGSSGVNIMTTDIPGGAPDIAFILFKKHDNSAFSQADYDAFYNTVRVI